jgi:methyl-accepting chemotaxis protein
MTPEQITLIKESFHKLAPAMNQFGPVFYARLFEVSPELRAIFRGNLDSQARALTAMVELIVKMLDMREKLIPLIHYLGERHAVLDVRPEHYRPFGEALMWTLALLLRDEFTPETRRAWQEAYAFMVENMT